MRLDFTKVEGLGNDFLLVDWRARAGWARDLAALQAAAPAICDRRRGVGGDGILVVAPPPEGVDAVASMIVINHDGSRPEMCGNGLRCVAHFLAVDTGATTMTVATDAGLRPCTITLDEDRRRARVAIEMGIARDLGPREPAAGEGRRFQAISVGNPHAIAFVGAAEDPEALARALGPAIEVDPLFPDRTNVELARIEGDGSITLWVWERGCGITEACGTGACATAAAAVLGGLAQAGEPLRVRLPGGDLAIRVPADGASIVMEGPATLVFHGEIELRAG
ncbi:MAG: diaminopimelate epimerase [Myxococcales bacterium]|nr:diaminopimelate epimerase [Myxococcales bacterium]